MATHPFRSSPRPSSKRFIVRMTQNANPLNHFGSSRDSSSNANSAPDMLRRPREDHESRTCQDLSLPERRRNLPLPSLIPQEIEIKQRALNQRGRFRFPALLPRSTSPSQRNRNGQYTAWSELSTLSMFTIPETSSEMAAVEAEEIIHATSRLQISSSKIKQLPIEIELN